MHVAAMTYDDREALATFHAAQGLRYPLLQDVDVKHVNAYGVLNRDYHPGDSGYGIPYPGVLYIGPDGVIRAKFAVPGYRQRPSFQAMLDAINDLQSAD